jgi:hypothetical protein
MLTTGLFMMLVTVYIPPASPLDHARAIMLPEA